MLCSSVASVDEATHASTWTFCLNPYNMASKVHISLLQLNHVVQERMGYKISHCKMQRVPRRTLNRNARLYQLQTRFTQKKIRVRHVESSRGKRLHSFCH